MGNRTVYCTKCGNQITCEADREFVFCTRCGHKNILSPLQPAVQPAPSAQSLSVSAAAPAVPLSVQRPVYQPVPVEPKADLSAAIACYNRGDFDTAEKCVSLLFETEPENSGVWFCACKVLATKKPESIEQAAVNYVNYASECLRLSGNNSETRGQLTIEFNHLLKNLIDSMLSQKLYFTPYDNNSMSESFPSVHYQPLQRADEYNQFFENCVYGFRNNVNPNYRDDYFRSLWNDAFFCIGHVLSKQLANDMNSSGMFYWYKSELSARSPGNNAYRALCDLIYGYRNTFFIMFDRVPFRDARTTIVNRIIYLDKWLLKLKYMDSRGVYVLHVPDPRQRLAFEQEMRNYKIMLSRS